MKPDRKPDRRASFPLSKQFSTDDVSPRIYTGISFPGGGSSPNSWVSSSSSSNGPLNSSRWLKPTAPEINHPEIIETTPLLSTTEWKPFNLQRKETRNSLSPTQNSTNGTNLSVSLVRKNNHNHLFTSFRRAHVGGIRLCR